MTLVIAELTACPFIGPYGGLKLWNIYAEEIKSGRPYFRKSMIALPTIDINGSLTGFFVFCWIMLISFFRQSISPILRLAISEALNPRRVARSNRA